MYNKHCRYCGLEFKPTHGNDGLCSDECTKEARKLRNFIRYNSIRSLMPVLLRNHEILSSFFERKQLEITAEELENEGLDFSLFRRLYPDPPGEAGRFGKCLSSRLYKSISTAKK
jgi:predicted nucleic acid-binding Zn ribbon protein